MRKAVLKHNRKQHILAIATGFFAALPIICLPIGLREDMTPAMAVSHAYEAIFGTRNVSSGEVVIEEWALVSSADQLVSGTVSNDVEPTEPTQYTEVSAPQSYTDIPKYIVYQQYDSSDLPIELLDPQYFAADEKQFYIQNTGVNLKEYPDPSKKTLRRMNYGEGVTRIGIGDTWSKVRTKDGTEGYILSTDITDEMVWAKTNLYVWVDTDSLILRKEPNTKSAMVKMMHEDDRLHVVAYADKWYKVETRDGSKGYVYKSFTTRTPPPTPTPTPTPRPTATKSSRSSGRYQGTTGNINKLPKITGKNGESIVNIAASMLGVRYVYGGCSRKGIDCSGLVKYCYAQIGISVPHGANMICNRSGVSVARSDLRLGDVLCYDYGSRCKHVAIYAGGGQVIHASQSRGRVLYGRLDMMPIKRIKRLIR